MKFPSISVLSSLILISLAGCATVRNVVPTSPTAGSQDTPVAVSVAPRVAADAQYGIGKSLVGSGQLDQAMEAFRRANELSPGHVDALNGQALIFSRRGDFGTAEQILRQVLKSHPASAISLSNLSFIMLRTMRLQEAADLMHRAWEIEPGMAVVKANWSELARLAVKDPAVLAAITQRPLGSSRQTLAAPVMSPEVVREVHTAVINIPAFPSTAPGLASLSSTVASRAEAHPPPVSPPRLTTGMSPAVMNIGYGSSLPDQPGQPKPSTIAPPAVALVRERPAVADKPAVQPPSSLRRPEPKATRVEIFNGNGKQGAAAVYGRKLAGKGLNVTKLANAKAYNQTQTVVYYAQGHLATAKTIASELPGKAMFVPFTRDAGYEIRVVLGRTGKALMI